MGPGTKIISACQAIKEAANQKDAKAREVIEMNMEEIGKAIGTLFLQVFDLK